MNAVITVSSVSSRLRRDLAALGVHHRPDLACVGAERLVDELLTMRALALVSERLPARTALDRWATATGGQRGSRRPARLVVVIAGAGGTGPTSAIDGVDPAVDGVDAAIEGVDPAIDGIEVHAIPCEEGDRDAALARALALVERVGAAALGTPQIADRCSGQRRATLSGRRATARENVLLVGAGVVNLVTAVALTKLGHPVRLIDQALQPGSPQWWRQGCTLSGEDARIVSFTEMRHHHQADRPGPIPNPAFHQTVSQGGWLLRRPESLNEPERAWCVRAAAIPGWLARSFDDDCAALNAAGYAGWCQLFDAHPEWARDADVRTPLLRIYATPAQLEAARARERALGSWLRDLDADDVAAETPALSAAARDDQIAGGLIVRGLSVRVHRLVDQLVTWLRAHDVPIAWQTRANAIVWKHGRVNGIATSAGTLEARHYVISTGAAGDSLLDGTDAQDQIAGVVGVWMSLVNCEPSLDRAFKYSRAGFGAPGAIEGVNVVVGVAEDGAEVIHLSGGHGYVGLRPPQLYDDRLGWLALGVRDAACKLFPGRPEHHRPHREGEPAIRCCVRPWAPSGLGLFAQTPAVRGGQLIVTGAHSTGGFAQAPAVAAAVAAAIRGERHPMQALYHPRRLAVALAGTSGQAEPAESSAVAREPVHAEIAQPA